MLIEKLKGSVYELGFARATVEKLGGGGESFDPKVRWHAGVKEKSTDAIVQCSKDPFNLPILW